MKRNPELVKSLARLRALVAEDSARTRRRRPAPFPRCVCCGGDSYPLTDGFLHVNTGPRRKHRWGRACEKCVAVLKHAVVRAAVKRENGICAMPRCNRKRAKDRTICRGCLERRGKGRAA